MELKVVLKKRRDGRVTLTCTRPDQSQSWASVRPGLQTHDLAHYVVESVLQYRHAFYGLILDGHEIADFELPRAQRPEAVRPENLGMQAIHTEFIVNQLESEQLNYGEDPDFMHTLAQALKNKGLPFPEGLDHNTLSLIRTQYRQLLQEWYDLPADQALTLVFSVDAD